MRALVVSGSRAAMPDPVYPLGAAIVATALRRAGHDVSWFDALRHEDPPSALAGAIERERPDAVALSIRNIDDAAFPNARRHFPEHLDLARAVRHRPGVALVLGGPAFSIAPEAFLEYLGADCGVVGEGEEAIVEIAAALEEGRRVETVVRAPRAAAPFVRPDRDLFDAAWYYDRGGTGSVQTKRGCPFECVYCTYPAIEGRAARLEEPGAVVDELEALARSGMRHAFVVDSVLNRPEEHAAAICEEIARRGLEMSLTAYLVPAGDLPELPALLRRAGFLAVELGTDSLSDPVLERLRKGFRADEAVRFSERLAREGIRQCHNLVLGGPGETEATMSESVDRMDDLGPTAVFLTLGLRVYPGTGLWRIAGGDSRDSSDPEAFLDPWFYVEEEVADLLVERARAWLADRPSWIAPGLGGRYNPRFLARLRARRKGLLWPVLAEKGAFLSSLDEGGGGSER